MPSWAAADRAKGPPEPKSRVIVQRTEKLSFGRPAAGALAPQFESIAASQSVRFAGPEKVALPKNCRSKAGDSHVTVAAGRVPRHPR